MSRLIEDMEAWLEWEHDAAERIEQCRRRVEWGGVMIPEAEMCDFLGPNPKAMWVEYMLRDLGQSPRG